MKVLALEPWYGGSHRNFLDGLSTHSKHDYHVITMSARFWKWRMHGGAVTMARKALEVIEKEGPPDVLFATDMLNVPAFLSLTRHVLSNTPLVLYVHENQLTYPLKEGVERDYTYAYINYLSCLAADRVVFNSAYHMDEYLEALPGMLRAFPDYNHLHSVQLIRQKSVVLHLGMDLRAHDLHAIKKTHRSRTHMADLPIVLWNQRWEYDKNPEAFFRMMNRLDDAGCSFRLILAGEHFEEQPKEFEKAFNRYAERILHYGYAEDFEEYSSLLHQADIIVSTAIHEFFGIAVLEAIYCGCHPLLPNKLSYPELIPSSLHKPLLHAPTLYKDEDHLFKILYAILMGKERPLPIETLREISNHLDWREQIQYYDSVLEEVTRTDSTPFALA
ncbi:MAG: DUF3524 domain-containing protein [Rhodothermaceae bacterium]|nr:DUF3524 domain-containing protein [Rhodothermaceae bacterium]